MRATPPGRVRRVLLRGGPVALVLVLWTTGLVAPAATPNRPVLESRVHDLSDSALARGRAAAVDTGLPTQAVGFDWDGATEGAMEVRAQVGDEWTPWVRVEGNPLEGPDRTSREFHGRTGAGPVWVGHGAGKLEVRVVEGDLRAVRLHAIRSEAPTASGGTSPAGSAVPPPPIVSRAAWGADESYRSLNPGCSQPEYADYVRFSVVHHTVNANNYGPGDGPALLRAIYYFHTHTNKWCDIGYNLLVDRYGQVYEGRFGGVTQPVIGAHAQGFNTGSTGVALLGTFTSEAVPGEMYAALRRVLAWKLAYHGVNPQSTVAAGGRTVPAIAGHRDVNATECPGDLAYNLLPQLRSQVAADIQASITKPALHRSGLFLLRNWQTTGAADAGFGFGDATDVAVMGDWDGNGTRTPGVFRDGQWYLRNSNSTGRGDVAFAYGDAGDVPVVGDWNGDGVDTPGIVRSGQWYLRNSNSTGRGEIAFAFGDPGDVPVPADWNGDRTDTPGVFRNGAWYARNSNSSGRGEVGFYFGNSGDLPAVADWNGDGVDSPGVFRAGVWYLRNSNTTGKGDVFFGFGDSGDRPRAWT